MSQSIGSKLSNLKHKGLISDDEYDRLKKALNSLEVDEMYQLEMENAEEFIAKSVLDKIKAEIEQIEINGHIRDVECFNAGINVALNVINKYKAENTPKKNTNIL